MPFGQWRRLARLHAALPRLAAGQAVGIVARHVGYETPSAFVAAFRRETGFTPAAYFSRRGAPIAIDAAGDEPPPAVGPGAGLA
jgi:AraC-like DNA-binding protein